MSTSIYEVLPLQYNSGCIIFSEWIALLTLCLAPVITHVAAGSPQPSYLTQTRPKWYDRICHYNPTSIIWRYAAITDRRLRAKDWSNADMAASNAIFWTDKGWDGSEHMVTSTERYCTQLPEHNRINFFSTSALFTLVVALQGVSSVYALTVGLVYGWSSAEQMAIDTIFFPLPIFGLFRLCAATWLTGDFAFRMRDDDYVKAFPTPSTPKLKLGAKGAYLAGLGSIIEHLPARGRFKPTSYWLSRMFRLLFILLFLGIWFISFAWVTPIFVSRLFTATAFVAATYYCSIVTVSVIIYAYYFARGTTTTTIIPCFSTPWYRLYSLIVIGATGVLILISALETNRIPRGVYAKYTSYTSFRTDTGVPGCPSLDAVQYMVGTTNSIFFGLVATGNETAMGDEPGNTWMPGIPPPRNHSLGGEVWTYNFTGYCVGSPVSD